VPRKTNRSVSSFGPELLAALIRGGEKTLAVPMPSFEAAFALRQRLYELRKALRSENHPDCARAYRASIALPTKEGDGSSVLTIRPKDEEFTAALRAVGITPIDTQKEASARLAELRVSQEERPEVESESPLGADYLATLLRDLPSENKV
jgi:hypothetical protein